ncbi:MAG: toprim domain-containing protein [Puniceicoccales bacterium]|jgi:hypothetical protein|nr:toprim domain-containing protein [Puniceicoccales bacterium]
MHSKVAVIKEQLAQRAADFCAHLFPDGNYRYGKFYIGDLHGNPGKSLVIAVDGELAGLWKDFATGDGGSNLLELLHQRNGGNDFSAAIIEAEKWLGGQAPCAIVKNPRPDGGCQKARRVSTNDLEKGTKADIAKLSTLLRCSLDGVQYASEQDVLYFFSNFENGRCWTVMPVFSEKLDGNAYSWPSRPGCVRQDRRLDGEPFRLRDWTECKARTVGSPKFPVAHFPLKKNVLLCEGSSDFIAAHSLICAEDMQSEFSAVSILGAGNNIAEEAIGEFSGRNVLIFPDYDTAGIGGARRWKEELEAVAGAVRFFDYAGHKRQNGQPIKDLRDFLQVNQDTFDYHREVQYPLGAFLVANTNIECENHE